MTRGMRRTSLLLVAALTLAACSGDSNGDSSGDSAVDSAGPAATTGGGTDAGTAPPTAAATGGAPTTTLPPATFTVQPGTEQVAVLGAVTGEALSLVGGDGAVAAEGTVDEQGALLWRDVVPGESYTVRSATTASPAFAVADPADPPPDGLFADQPLLPADGGFGYVTVRDGTTLSANVVLPGPADGGPYPTVVEYSGYSPSDPDNAAFAQIFTSMGFAWVGVNMRGTGCSGGSYRFFETVQSLDGYDVIEAIAAQPWVQDHRVGMVGVSYPGISQLFVAATQPPSLEAITPLSVIDDSYRGTLYPGGILNTGFAVRWTSERMSESAPFGQAWTKERADAGDTRCAENQQLRLQNPDLVAEIGNTPFYSDTLGDSLAPITFVDRIEVPVFLAGAWQDEQTGGHFPAMLDRFTSAPELYVTLVNGLHTESLSPPIFARLAEFLQLYVAHAVPSMGGPNAVVPTLAASLYGTPNIPPFEDRFAGQTYEQALAAFEAEPHVRMLLDQGASPDAAPGTPMNAGEVSFDEWPAPADTTEWFLGDGGTLAAAAGADGAATYSADPTALPATFFTGSGNEVWRADVTYDWRPLPEGTGVGFVTAPLERDLLIAGGGAVELTISAGAADTDLEVTLSEIRPDGTEIYVQSGWLRASMRALDPGLSTELQPVPTFTEADAVPLVPGEATEVFVALFPVGHVVRAGSQLRLTIDAPSNNRAVWEFQTVSAGEQVTVAYGAAHPSRLLLPTTEVTTDWPLPPACGALRGQPCRAYLPAANGG